MWLLYCMYMQTVRYTGTSTREPQSQRSALGHATAARGKSRYRLPQQQQPQLLPPLAVPLRPKLRPPPLPLLLLLLLLQGQQLPAAMAVEGQQGKSRLKGSCSRSLQLETAVWAGWLPQRVAMRMPVRTRVVEYE